MALKHVLVVDDDPMILEVVERALEGANFRVSKARRVSVAKDVLVRQTIDLIISDARIPGETGLQLARLLGAEPFSNAAGCGDLSTSSV